MLGLLAVDLWYQPLWAYDAWTFWTPKAHALYALNGLDPSWFGANDLLNRDYPLLLPAVEAATFRFTGYETSLLDLQSWLALAAFLARSSKSAVGWAAGRSLLVAVLLSLVFAPSVADQLASAEADIPLAAMFACAGLAACVWLEERRGRCARARGGACGRLRCDQDRGHGVRDRALRAARRPGGETRAPRRRTRGAAGVAALAIGIVPWRIWLSIHDVPEQVTVHRLTSPSLLAGHVDRLPRAAAYMAWKAFDPRAWILLVPLCLAVLVLSAARVADGVLRRRGGRPRPGGTGRRVLDDAAAVPLPPRHVRKARDHRADLPAGGAAAAARNCRSPTLPSPVVTAVLFTCAGQRVDIVTAFARAGATTIATDVDQLAPALYHADRRALVPRVDDPGYIAALRDLVELHDVRLIVPLTDLDHLQLAQARDELRRRGRARPEHRDDPALLRQVPRARVLRRAGHRLAGTWLPDELPADLAIPVLVKARRGFGSRHIYRADNRAELDFFLAYTTADSMVQARLSGRGILDRRLLRHRRALPRGDPADDDRVEGRRIDQGDDDQGRRADRVRRGRSPRRSASSARRTSSASGSRTASCR